MTNVNERGSIRAANTLPKGYAGRASRKSGACTKTADIKESRPQQKVGSNKQYGCFYKTARLLYTATVVKG